MFEKWPTFDPKRFYAIPFQKLVFWVSLCPTFLGKKTNKKSWFLVNSRCFCFAFHANLMSGGKAKRLKFLFIAPLILLIKMSISLFWWTLQPIKTQKFFVTKTTKLCSYNSGEQNSRILSLHRKQKIKHFFSALFNSRYKFINPWKYRSQH